MKEAEVRSQTEQVASDGVVQPDLAQLLGRIEGLLVALVERVTKLEARVEQADQQAKTFAAEATRVLSGHDKLLQAIVQPPEPVSKRTLN